SGQSGWISAPMAYPYPNVNRLIVRRDILSLFLFSLSLQSTGVFLSAPFSAHEREAGIHLSLYAVQAEERSTERARSLQAPPAPDAGTFASGLVGCMENQAQHKSQYPAFTVASCGITGCEQ